MIRQAYAECYGDDTTWQHFFKSEDTAVSMIRYLDDTQTRWESVDRSERRSYDTIADMRQLLSAECHPSGAVGCVHYLCSALREASPPPPRSARDCLDTRARAATENGQAWVAQRAPLLWANLANQGPFDWSALYDPDGRDGPDRFHAQLVTTPREPLRSLRHPGADDPRGPVDDVHATT